ncbi:M20/M25/M40 family metallo-hydrolase [Flavobacterium sp. ALJ2]|uniref:M20/M25/M40 family metallo-hydrolase n=1 Tax=Flavobacterium sp. ALJ2 TaxID=2786960 RepID=UPI00189D2AB1|nr:M20/M25/M40 family metallo-hydrolase [Flavobacterium sp. ALJ2]MBF7092464.1 M20/M25/M40 family metallo-hydrolase [Flavobacterium sp. ALJ2]
MRQQFLLPVILFLCKSVLFSQTIVQNPSKSDFSGTLSFLASDWMEGRGSTQKGGFMASEYIASMMELYQLIPYNSKSGYFQDFKILEHTVKKTSFEIKKRNTETLLLSPENDYQVTPITQSLQREAQIVFAGYGLSIPKEGCDDYKNLNVKGKIVVILKGFPGHQDSTSTLYQKFKKLFPEENNLEEVKIQTAINKNAIALIIIGANGDPKFKNFKEDALLHSLETPTTTAIPLFKLNKSAAEKLFSGNSISLETVEKNYANKIGIPPVQLKNTTVNFSIELQTKTFPVRNVLGMIQGKDTTKTIIVGAHYDHLGIINDTIYNGADDNASGVSGMLALAKNWSESKIKPPCNILFASWTAEEMGLLGSQNFIQNFDLKKQKILLVINMDMISRSAPEDKTHRVLSIGTQEGSDSLKEIITFSNSKLSKPFTLDLWETNGHTGSDYASFAAKGIPVMTYFSGFHDDYHSIRDVASKVDLDKIQDVLFIINTSLLRFIANMP